MSDSCTGILYIEALDFRMPDLCTGISYMPSIESSIHAMNCSIFVRNFNLTYHATLFQVFLGGLPSTITETDLRSFFTNYGEVCEVVIMYDQEKKKSRGFGFLSFENEVARERAVADHFVMIQNKQVSALLCLMLKF